MAWPTSQDYNEAIQSPAANFADADLKRGEAATNVLGLPMPFSGNFADVYEVRGPGSGRWAVKCFTREVPGLRERYTEISRHLRQAKLPFTVDFSYLEQGIRVSGRWYPVLKMQWVEGLTFNQFVSQNLDKPAVLEALLQLWIKMAKYLRTADVAHGDLQHGNILLVPGSGASSLALKLIDYDGMWVPALAGMKSGEAGHPSYQHPQRLRDGTYSREVDRFPLLLIATALTALKAQGRSLWEKYDNGDNLLFREADLREPAQSALLSDLAQLPDPPAMALTFAVRKALSVGLESVPLLEDVFRPIQPPRPLRTVTASPAALPTAIVRARAVPQVGKEMPTDDGGFDPGSLSTPLISKPGRTGILFATAAIGTVIVVVGCAGVGYLAMRGSSRQVALAPSHPLPNSPADTKPQLNIPGRTNPALTSRDNVAAIRPEKDGTDFKAFDPKIDLDRDIDADPYGPVGEMRRFVGHTTEIRRMAISPNGKQLLTACWDKTLRIWDVPSGRELLQWDGHKNWVHGVAFLPDGRQAVSCGKEDKTVRLWDLKDGHEVRTYAGNTQGPHCVAVSGDGRLVASCGPQNTVFVWELSTGMELHRLEEPSGGVNSVVFAKDGQLILTGGMRGPIRLWDAETGKQLRQFEGHVGDVIGLAFSNDAKFALSCGADKTLRLWNMDTAKEIRQYVGHTSAVNSVAFSPDGGRVLSCSGDETVRLWDTATGKELYSFRGHKNHVWTVAFSPGGQHAYSSGQDAIVRMWRLPPLGYVSQNTTKGTPVVKKLESRLPVPSREAVAAAERRSKEDYKAEFAKRRPEDVLALANLMLKDSTEAKDKPALRYYLLGQAGDFAARLGDLSLAFRVSDELANLFAIDALEQKVAALELAGRNAANLTEHTNVILYALALADDAEEEDQYEAADRLVKAAQTSAAVTRQPLHTNLVQGRAKEVVDLRKAYEPVPDAVRRLKSKGDDPDANLEVGKYYAFAKGDWERALLPLSLGNDSKLKALALADLGATADSKAAANLGDSYAELGAAEVGEAKKNLLGRACYWYGRAQLKYKGDEYATVAKKRAEIEKTLPPTRPVVLSARYGGYNGWAEVTMSVRRQLLQAPGQKMPSKVIDFGVDPAPGHHKAVAVVYRYRGAVRLAIAGEPNTPSIPGPVGAPDAQTGILSPGQELSILYALSGTEATWVDVTDRIQGVVKGAGAEADLDALHLPDNFFGRHKAVIVVYRHEGKIRLSTYPHDGTLRLGVSEQR